MVVDQYSLPIIYKETFLKIYPLHNKTVQRDFLIIASGNMFEWYKSINLGCREFAEYDIRVRMNYCLRHFEQTSFKEIWSNYTKKNLTDGTFCLRRI